MCGSGGNFGKAWLKAAQGNQALKDQSSESLLVKLVHEEQFDSVGNFVRKYVHARTVDGVQDPKRFVFGEARPASNKAAH